MERLPIKLLTISVMVAILFTSNLLISIVSVQTKRLSLNNPMIANNLAVSILFKEQLQTVTKNVLRVEAYAKSVLITPTFTLSGLNQKHIITINSELQFAQKNPRNWLNVIRPSLIYLNQDVINFSNTYQSYTDILKKYVDEKNTASLKENLQRLATNTESE